MNELYATSTIEEQYEEEQYEEEQYEEEQYEEEQYVDWKMTNEEDERKCENLESSIKKHKDEVVEFLKEKYPEELV